MRRRTRSFGAVLAAVLLTGVFTAGCATNATSDAASDTSAVSAGDTSSTVAGGSGDVQWSGELIGGGSFDLAIGAGEEPVALWFWAPG